MTTTTEPDLADMPVAALLEAIAVNSDLATHIAWQASLTTLDDEAASMRDEATRHVDRRAACMREVQRRFDALTPGGNR